MRNLSRREKRISWRKLSAIALPVVIYVSRCHTSEARTVASRLRADSLDVVRQITCGENRQSVDWLSMRISPNITVREVREFDLQRRVVAQWSPTR